jgi:hypothetical protein
MTRVDEGSRLASAKVPAVVKPTPRGFGSGCGRRRVATACMVTVIALAVLVDITPSGADSTGAIPSYAVRVAGGSLKLKGHWGIWVFGRRGVGRCWGTRIVEKGLPNETAYCGYSVPRQSQQLAVRGTFPAKQGPESLLFFLTRRNVALLKVLIDRPGGRRELLRIHARAIGSGQAHRAHMQPTFGYGMVTFSGRLSCIKRVVAWTRSGLRVGASRSASCNQ